MISLDNTEKDEVDREKLFSSVAEFQMSLDYIKDMHSLESSGRLLPTSRRLEFTSS